jgi:hypothetical protein
MMTGNKPTLDDLLRLNPKADPDLIAKAVAKINEIRSTGIVTEGYRITERRSTLRGTEHCVKATLPRRHR